MVRLRIAMFVAALGSAGIVFADLTPKTLQGRVWIDAAPSGTFIRIDRASRSAPDGTVDEELTLFQENRIVDRETIEIPDAAVIVMHRSVVIRDRQSRARYVLAIDDEPASNEPAFDDSITIIRGYGIRHTILGESLPRHTIVADPSWRQPEALVVCDAGGTCGSTQCSVACGADRECSVTCSGNKMACCVCAGRNKTLPSCTCLFCT